MGTEIEPEILACMVCQESRRVSVKAAVFTWKQASQPWHTILLDFSEAMAGQKFLVVVDAHTK